jgi:putative transposase
MTTFIAVRYLYCHSEQVIQRGKTARGTQQYPSAFGPISQPFRPRRHLLSASEYRQEMKHRFESWAEITGTKRPA